MADWPPKIGSKWRDDIIWREILWRDEKRVQVLSRWKIKNGTEASHVSTVRKDMWLQWPGRELETFK